MYYINPQPTNANHGNPMGQPFADCVALPDELLSDYLACKGFAILSVENGTVTAVEANQEALDAYEAEHPETEPEDPEPTTEDRVADLEAENKLLKAQVDALSEQNDFHEELIVELAQVVYA